MSNELKPLGVEDATGRVLEEIDNAFFDIPYENSEFQTRAFVIAAAITPARAYRSIGLRMHSKIQAVKEFKFKQERNKIDIEEKEAEIAASETSDFDRRRLRLDIMQIQDGEVHSLKLLNDALRELDVLYAEFKKLPRYTRQQFEAEERVHFAERLNRQLLPGGGAREALDNMNKDLPDFDKRIALAVQNILALADKG